MYFKTERGPVRVNPTVMRSKSGLRDDNGDESDDKLKMYLMYGSIGLLVLIILILIIWKCFKKSSKKY